MNPLLNRFRLSVERRCSENALLDRQIVQCAVVRDTAAHQFTIAKTAAEFVDRIASVTRNTMQLQFHSLVTSALHQIYGPSLSFEMEWSFKRDRPALDFFIRHGEIRRSTSDGNGGGVLDLIAIILRLLITSLIPNAPRVLVLDEPSKHLDEERNPRLGLFLSQLCHDFGWQIICVTHSSQLAEAADVSYEVVHNGSCAIVHGPRSLEPCGYLRSLSMRRFESHLDSEVHFSEFFTVFHGLSHVGKTSILRALRLMAYGDWLPDQVFGHQGIAEVELTTQYGAIQARKGKQVNEWKITPLNSPTLRLKNVGRGAPEEAIALHHFRPVPLGGRSVPIHFADQLESHFLLASVGGENASSGLAAKILDSLTGLEGVDELSSRLALYRKRQQDQVRSSEEQMASLESQKHDAKLLARDTVLLEQATALSEACSALLARQESIQSLQSRWLSTCSEHQNSISQLARFSFLPQANATFSEWQTLSASFSGIQSRWEALCEAHQKQNALQAHSLRLRIDAVESSLHLWNAASRRYLQISSLWSRYQQASARQDHLFYRAAAISSLPDAEPLFASLNQDMQRIALVQSRWKILSQKQDRYGQLKNRLGVSHKDFSNLQSEYDEWLRSVETCPYCGQLLPVEVEV